MSNRHPKADRLFDRAKMWRDEMKALRAIMLETELKEEIKWRQPCYCLEGRNVAIISSLKDCCTLSLFKGVLLDDPEGLLELPGPNTQSARVIKLRSLEDIASAEAAIRSLIRAAIEVEKQGRTVPFKETAAYDMPPELIDRLATDAAFKAAFEALTPGRQRGYILHFGSAKQSATRSARIERCLPRIQEGKGWNER